MDYVILGKNIRKYRQMRGMRQEDLAEICDCGNSHGFTFSLHFYFI